MVKKRAKAIIIISGDETKPSERESMRNE